MLVLLPEELTFGYVTIAYADLWIIAQCGGAKLIPLLLYFGKSALCPLAS
jgi:hypothetical protein